MLSYEDLISWDCEFDELYDSFQVALDNTYYEVKSPEHAAWVRFIRENWKRANYYERVAEVIETAIDNFLDDYAYIMRADGCDTSHYYYIAFIILASADECFEVFGAWDPEDELTDDLRSCNPDYFAKMQNWEPYWNGHERTRLLISMIVLASGDEDQAFLTLVKPVNHEDPVFASMDSTNENIRFFTIVRQLPLELQELIAGYVYDWHESAVPKTDDDWCAVIAELNL